MAAHKGHPKFGGRAKGTSNKSTLAAREAIAAFVDGNAHRLQAWLDEIANGLPKLDNEGKPIAGVYLVDPNPTRAFELFQSVIEYHVPKLARTEVVGEDGKSAFQIHINA